MPAGIELDVSPETVRRWLHRGDMVYRRPRPTVGPRDEQREAKLAALRELLAELPPDETVVWQDEADINTNPEIGRMWMRRGQQSEIPTPGTNEKRYVAGSIHWRTGMVFATEGPKRDEELFLAHLEDLRHRLRRYRKIHVICDCAKFHHSDAVQDLLWRSTAIGSSWRCCRRTARTPIRWSGSGGWCGSMSRGIIGVGTRQELVGMVMDVPGVGSTVPA